MNARQKTGTKDEQTKGKEPQPPEDLVDEALPDCADEETTCRVRRVEVSRRRAKESGAAEESQGGDVIQRVEKSNGGRDQNQGDHQSGPRLIHAAEQTIESDGRGR